MPLWNFCGIFKALPEIDLFRILRLLLLVLGKRTLKRKSALLYVAGSHLNLRPAYRRWLINTTKMKWFGDIFCQKGNTFINTPEKYVPFVSYLVNLTSLSLKVRSGGWRGKGSSISEEVILHYKFL